MRNIDIERLDEIRDELEDLEEEDCLFVDDEEGTKYVIMPIAFFDRVEDIANALENGIGATVKIANPQSVQLTYEEYESVREQIIDAIDKTFKPKPEKLN